MMELIQKEVINVSWSGYARLGERESEIFKF